MKTRFAPLRPLGAIMSALALFWANPAVAQSTTAPAPSTSGNATADIPANPFGPKPEPSDADKAAAKAALTDMTGATVAPARPRAGAPARSTLDPITTELRQLLLQRFDKNGTGTLNAAEIEEARKVLSGRADIAALTPAQATQAAQGPLFGLRPLIIRIFDKNGDGTLDATELATVRAALAVPASSVATPIPLSANEDLATLRQDIIKHFNADGTGRLTDSEKAAATAWLQQMQAELDKTDGPTPRTNIPVPSSPAPVVNLK